MRDEEGGRHMTSRIAAAYRRTQGGSQMTKRIVTMVVTGVVLVSSLTGGTPSAAAQPVSGPVIAHLRPTLPWIPSRPAARAPAQRDHDRAATRLRLPTGLGTAAVLPGDLTYHGGSVLHNPTVHLIFWLPS